MSPGGQQQLVFPVTPGAFSEVREQGHRVRDSISKINPGGNRQRPDLVYSSFFGEVELLAGPTPVNGNRRR